MQKRALDRDWGAEGGMGPRREFGSRRPLANGSYEDGAGGGAVHRNLLPPPPQKHAETCLLAAASCLREQHGWGHSRQAAYPSAPLWHGTFSSSPDPGSYFAHPIYYPLMLRDIPKSTLAPQGTALFLFWIIKWTAKFSHTGPQITGTLWR